MPAWIAAVVLSLVFVTGCRAPPDGGMLRPELWGEGWWHTVGVSGDAGFTMHRRPRMGPVARTYFFFVDRRCQLVPGTVHVEPWRARKISPELDLVVRAKHEHRFRRYAEPTETLEISRWQLHASGGYVALPTGTWRVTARASIQQSPLAAARAREWDVDARANLHATADHDFALVFDRIVPTREDRNGNGSPSGAYRRSMRQARRCYAGNDMTPRFTVEQEWVDRCATTGVEDRSQATGCDAM